MESLNERAKSMEEARNSSLAELEDVKAQDEAEINTLLDVSLDYSTLLLKLLNQEQLHAADIDNSLNYIENISEHARKMPLRDLSLKAKLDLLQTTSAALSSMKPSAAFQVIKHH